MTPVPIRTEIKPLMGQVRSFAIRDPWTRRFVGDMHDRLYLDRPISQANQDKIIELAGRY